MDSEKFVPVFEQLDNVYANVDDAIKAKHIPRYENLLNRFKKAYGALPKFYCRAPGRVNIIGEHIDYCGYSVLPAAIEQDFIMAYSPVEEGEAGEAEIEIRNIDEACYATITISTDPFQKMQEHSHFVNYFLCGYKAILAHHEDLSKQVAKPKGMKILIDSLVPAASGLSSSSAFTVCAAVTTAHANGMLGKISQQRLADITINAERMAGTACGGMDQTISIMGEMGQAKLIDFVPAIKVTEVKIPDSVCLVIANSCTASPKLLTLGTRYNKRVVECRFAVCAMAIAANKATSFEDCTFKTFQELQVALGYSFEQMLELVNEAFPQKEAMTPEQISQQWGVEDVFSVVASVPHVMDVKNQNTHFDLYKRAYHVLGEAKRVHDFKAVCEDQSLDEETKVNTLGKLMNESHLSCHLYYDCSSTQLEEVTKLARDSGALGSRLTGAGWGGCSVSLVKKEILKEFIDKMYNYYEREREPGQQLWITDDLERYLFATNPAQGACVIDPKFTVWHQ